MKQPIIDISGEPAGNTHGAPVIIFYKENSWDAACQLEQGSNHHEGHYGCYLKPLSSREKCLSVDSVEHATKIVEALQLAIQERWLFTEKELKCRGSARTRGALIEKLRKD